jgi:hypothetical protein
LLFENLGYNAATGFPEAPAAISSADSNISTFAPFCAAAKATELAAMPLPIIPIFFFLLLPVFVSELSEELDPISL